MDRIDNKLECHARELIAYLATDPNIEAGLLFAVGFKVQNMRAAVFAEIGRALMPAHRCRLYRGSRL